MARRLLPALALLAAAMVAGIAAAGDLDTLAGTAGGQPGQQGQGAGAAGTAAEQIQASQEAAQALQSVEPTNLNPLLGSFLIPQWRDDKKPDLWVGQGQLFLKNQDPARALCSVVYTIRINFAQDQMVAGMKNMSLLGTYGTDMHQDMVWLRGKFPKWMPRLGPQQQLNIAYTVSAPASALPAPGAFFVESAAFCPSDTTTAAAPANPDDGGGGGGNAKDAVAGVLSPILPAGGDGNRRHQRRQRRRALRVSSDKAPAAVDADPAAAVESWAAVDDNILQNPVDGRYYVQAQTRLNNTDATRGRCNVQFKVLLDELIKAPGAGAGLGVRLEEGYLVNATLNAQGELEGKLAPSFNRIPPGRYVNVAYVLSAPSKEALALSNFTVTAAEAC